MEKPRQGFYPSGQIYPPSKYEENAFLSTSSHEGRSITAWNIDGLAEHQIYNKLHEMGVAITAYKMRGSADKEATTMIAAGFTGYDPTRLSFGFLEKRFISGLPLLFADKVRTTIQDRNDDRIPYSSLTYGDLVNTNYIVGLELCTDIKLIHQLKKEHSSSRRELGSFCRDFGFITPPDKVKKDKSEKKSHRKKPRRRDNSTRPRRKKSKSKRPKDT
ncbi:hypothetical protein KY290_027814 [Solanum tuberosum]|uniref:DUF7746 domain-containing protein n=1 Tax=Solanum tuberosum TaxID=4113 RepID=A0ABQ7UHX2_SOLTU|nr:hypothetical protein KY290_027814 [Solanum tuberosum]